MRLTEKDSSLKGAFTLVEVAVATLLLATFFASIFELNAICLRYIQGSKESVAAIAAVQDRTEVLRNLAFRDLTNANYLQNLLLAPANGSSFCGKATEVITLSAYPTANGVTKLTRNPIGSVALNSTAADLGTELVKLTISNSWTAVLGNRPRNEETTTIISDGTKK